MGWLKRRKFWLIALGLPTLLCLLIQTQPVERLILAEVAAHLPEGYHLEAERLDLNLFRLRAKLKNLVLTGPTLEVRLAQLEVNAAAGVLRGKIDVDAIALDGGSVVLLPAPPTPEDDAPLVIPDIRLGRATLRDVTFRYLDREAALDLALEQIRLGYEQGRLTFGLTSPARMLGERPLPAAALELTARTRSFRELDDLALKLTTEMSRLELKGRLDLKGAADLTLEASLNRDLLPEAPGLELHGSLRQGFCQVRVEGQYPLLEQDRAYALKTGFQLDAKPLSVPIELNIAELVSGKIELVHQETGWGGTYRFEGVAGTFAKLHPLLAGLRRVQLDGALMVPEKMADSQAHADLSLKGMPQLDLQVHYQQGVLSFSGQGVPVKSSTLHLVGDYDFKRIHAKLDGAMPHLDGLPGLEGLPPELCAGPVSFYGDVYSDLDSWRLQDFTLDLAEVAYEPWIRDHVVIDLEGQSDNLRGSVLGWHLNRRAPIATFNLDLEARRWNRLSLFLDAPSMYLDQDRRYRLQLRADGAGPLAEPVLSGYADVEISGPSGLQARLATPLALAANRLTLSDLAATTAHAAVSGQAHLDLGEHFGWDADLRAEILPDAAFQPLLPLALPRATLTIAGTQANLAAHLEVPAQRLDIPDLALTLDKPIAMNFEIVPPERVHGKGSSWSIAGLDLDDLDVAFENDRISGSLLLRARNTYALRRALGDLWPADLTLDGVDGKLVFDSDSGFQQPRAELELTWVEGLWCNADFWAQNAVIRYDHTLSFEPFKARFAGVDLQVASASPRDGLWPNHLLDAAEHPEDTGIALNFELASGQELSEFLELPAELGLDQLSGTVLAFVDADFQRPRAAVRDISLRGRYEEHDLALDDLDGFYHRGIWLQSGRGLVDNLPIQILPNQSGFQVHAEPGVGELEAWVHGFAGASSLDTTLTWINESDTDFQLELQMRQDDGTLVYIDPWLSFSDLALELHYSPHGGVNLRELTGNLNGGSLALSGKAVPEGDGYDTTFSGTISEVTVETSDMRADLSTALEWHANRNENLIRATAYAGGGYLAPNIAVKTLVEDLLKAVPELNFPDPQMEAIQLEAFVSTTDPMIIETDIAYLEVEVPWMIIGGNAAEPRPVEGYVLINSGSSLDLGNQAFVFHDSQIQFLRNRPNDPYLLITLEPADDANKNALNLNGFLSELSQNVDTQNLTAILANYLVGQVSTMVSLESDQGKALYDDSFTFVVSKNLARKVVTRYAIPVNKPASARRAELSLGPYHNNYLNLINRENRLKTDLQHSRKFGYPKGKRPPRIRKVSWPDNTPKWVRKTFKLRSDQVYSETLWRRARLDMVRRLKERGFLSPTLEHTWTKGVLAVQLDFGQRTRLAIEGPHMSEREMALVYRSIPSLDAEGLRSLETQVERLTLAKGYPSVAAMARRDGDIVHVRVLFSDPIGDVSLDFGEGQALLEPLYKDKKAREAFIAEYLVSADAARARLRARLAAKGYVDPEIGNGAFVDYTHFKLPISLGKRAELLEVVEDGNPLPDPRVGKPFSYGMIDDVASALQAAAGHSSTVSVRPRRRDNDVYLEVVRTPIEETTIQSLTISGASRIQTETILRFMGFKPGMSQQELVEAQQRLISAGPFSSARLRAESDATLEVLERNRWDADVSVSYDEQDKFGESIQFHDYQLFHGFNDLSLGLANSQLANEAVGKIKFGRVWGTPLDISLHFNWKNQIKDPNPTVDDEDPFGLIITQETLQSTSDPSIEFSYPINRNQELLFGVNYTEHQVRVLTTYDDNGEITEEESTLSDLALPVRLSWVYKHLDSPTNPRNGALATVSLAWFSDQGARSLYTGQRLKASLSTFKSFGDFIWLNRMETGLFSTEGIIPETIDPEKTEFFVVGGPATVRGYSKYLLGPLKIDFLGSDEERYVTIKPKAGRSMFFTSQELTYNTPYFGLGITPFADAGWVWEETRDWFKTDLVVTGGLGLSLDTPVGYFRLDWARPISEGPLRDLIEAQGFDEVDLKLFKSKQESSWYLRFGRIF